MVSLAGYGGQTVEIYIRTARVERPQNSTCSRTIISKRREGVVALLVVRGESRQSLSLAKSNSLEHFGITHTGRGGDGGDEMDNTGRLFHGKNDVVDGVELLAAAYARAFIAW